MDPQWMIYQTDADVQSETEMTGIYFDLRHKDTQWVEWMTQHVTTLYDKYRLLIGIQVTALAPYPVPHHKGMIRAIEFKPSRIILYFRDSTFSYCVISGGNPEFQSMWGYQHRDYRMNPFIIIANSKTQADEVGTSIKHTQQMTSGDANNKNHTSLLVHDQFVNVYESRLDLLLSILSSLPKDMIDMITNYLFRFELKSSKEPVLLQNWFCKIPAPTTQCSGFRGSIAVTKVSEVQKQLLSSVFLS